jgi:hypothetical protein
VRWSRVGMPDDRCPWELRSWPACLLVSARVAGAKSLPRPPGLRDREFLGFSSNCVTPSPMPNDRTEGFEDGGCRVPDERADGFEDLGRVMETSNDPPVRARRSGDPSGAPEGAEDPGTFGGAAGPAKGSKIPKILAARR